MLMRSQKVHCTPLRFLSGFHRSVTFEHGTYERKLVRPFSRGYRPKPVKEVSVSAHLESPDPLVGQPLKSVIVCETKTALTAANSLHRCEGCLRSLRVNDGRETARTRGGASAVLECTP